MKDQLLVERILSAHADALNQGIDHTDYLVERFGEQVPNLRELLDLASGLKKLLVPMTAAAPFVSLLHDDLVNAADASLIGAFPRSGRPRWVTAGVIASVAVGAAGLILWRYGWRGSPALSTASTVD